ncbi:hypothetical protein B5F76_05915 [Desulfovibrio sp. An276]|uniref:hypothetical protein n=1 Tax=Desulfovibrio sp. An276 TaxID=1965618 RepID=UPI000B39EBCC|nr:hypothetical protein [Desulfovibrio sp. An276]OUO53313.1 hypothetical protein B5F76_05915 [Desulfovibrio sp. An276]
MGTVTYEQIRTILEKKGYSLECAHATPPGLPEWPERSLVSLTPEQARLLLNHDNALNKTRKKRIANQMGADLQMGTFSSNTEEIRLLQNYKIHNRTYLLEGIASGAAPVDVYINVKNPNKFGFGNDHEAICAELVHAVKQILQEHGSDLPELDQSVWEEELPKKLVDKIDIGPLDPIRVPDAYDMPEDPITVIGVLSTDRSTEFPDKLYIVRGNSQSGEATKYPCTLIPASGEQRLALKPGAYTGLFSPDTHTDIGFVNLVQNQPVQLYYPIIEDNVLTGYKESPYTFMRVTIPVQSSGNGIIPAGAKFDTTNTEDLFITALGLDFIVDTITYIVLEDTDFTA